MRLIGLDFETFGNRDITKVGLDNYIADPDFVPLIAHTSTDVSGLSSRHSKYADEGFDFVVHDSDATLFRSAIANTEGIVAHNVAFERAVLQRMGIPTYHIQWYDSAVIARAMGASSHLAGAAPQLLNTDKMAEGRGLIQKFSVGAKRGGKPPTRDEVINDPDWGLYHRYCGVDSELALRIEREYGYEISSSEYRYAEITHQMNQAGWPVDREALKHMQRRYEDNKAEALENFRRRNDVFGQLNLSSYPQLKQWCLDRGVRATSFDEKHVALLISKIEKRLATANLTEPKYNQLHQVLELLRTKQTLGGSSLTKLAVIERTVGDDGRLRDQYLHIGAGQTYRTTGRGVQMQNLKRLHNPRDMRDLALPDVGWTNEELATNLRQLFTASTPGGSLIVGDFSSVESRGLAYLAGAEWKLEAFRNGKDMYKVMAAKIFGKPYEDITKDERQKGKGTELGCGYGAGPDGAAQFFPDGTDREEIVALVKAWREMNPEIVELWSRLGDGVEAALRTGDDQRVLLGNHMLLFITTQPAPDSLSKQHPGSQTLKLHLTNQRGFSMTRYFHGCYMRGRDVCYYKPSDRVHGDSWSAMGTNPKGGRYFYKLYGGKLAGILTQSFCRELFFQTLETVHEWADLQPGIQVIGQFHDEIVVDYDPTTAEIELHHAVARLALLMSSTTLQGFPLRAEVNADYRYIK